MHTLGKVFTWLTVVLAIGAIVLSLRLLDVRNSWTKQASELKQANEANAQNIAEQGRRLRNLRAELHRTTLIWGRFWNGQAGVLDRNAGTLQVRVGTNQGVGVPDRGEPPTLHAFRPTQDGGVMYVGEFRVATLRENESALQPIWRVRAGETQTWQPGTWRFREAIPPDHQTRFLNLRTELTVADELFAAKQDYLRAQEDLIRSANEHLRYRRQELIGDPNDPKNKGLNGEVAAEEEARNKALADVDDLRRIRENALQRIKELIATNKELADRLPGPKPAVAVNASADE